MKQFAPWIMLLVFFCGGFARSEDGQNIDDAERSAHWAFEPLSTSNRTAVSSSEAAGGSIDEFIIDKLRAAGLNPSNSADRRTLVLRAYKILHGLKPSYSALKAALEDSRANWYEALVDELLASPRFGERWARHWLDAARYAESNGFETNRPRANAYRYRDYVVDALNSDKPYNQFVNEQIAGDRYGEDIATGFLVAGPFDIVKSPDPELTLMQRADELSDFVSATSTTFLGLTVACARCHDHKFDPISQVDYYAMVAVFAGVKHGDRAVPRPTTEEEKAELAALDSKLATTRQEISRLPVREAVNSVRNVDAFDPVDARVLRFTILETNSGEPCIDELEVWSAASDAAPSKNVALSGKPNASGTLPGYAIHKLEHINDGKHGNTRSWISNTPGKGWVEIDFGETRRIDKIVWARDSKQQFSDRVATRYRVDVAVQDGEWKTVATSDDRLPFGASLNSISKTSSKSLSTAELERLKMHLRKLQSLEAERKRLMSRSIAPVAWVANSQNPGKTHLLYRGDPLAPRQQVAPNTLERFGKLNIDSSTPEAERRAALARWITDASNPLTARVMVNRIWQGIFGQGIVTTPNDFGLNGARPTHPKLLDHLASELIRQNWSMKSLIRQIVLSSTFKQSSRPSEKALGVDAAGNLYWRFTPRRMEAEAIRDFVVAASGNLDLRMGGPGFEVVVPLPGNVYAYVVKRTFGPADWRRAVYGHQIRGEQDATFGVFDCPDGGQSAPKRARSTTALQALNLLNSPFVIQQSELLAERVSKRMLAQDPGQKIRQAFRATLLRDPRDSELAASESFVAEHGLNALCRALINCNEFLFVE